MFASKCCNLPIATLTPLALTFLLLLGSGTAWSQESLSAAGNTPQAPTEYDGENIRENMMQPQDKSGKKDSASPKAIGSITTNDSFCYQPDAALDVCYINWRLHSVSAGADSMRSLRIRINGKVRLNMQGFFQTSLLYQTEMVNPGGFKVACGPPSVADPLVGTSHSFQITGVDSNGLTANNFGSISCPAFSP